MTKSRKINLEYQQVFFISDTHFGHRAMVEQWRKNPYTGLRFLDKEHMDEHLIAEWNTVVPKNGIVFHLGDVSFRNQRETAEILCELNGEIHLIDGNHDKGINGAARDIFRSINPYLELSIRVEGRTTPIKIVLCHYPILSWNGMHHGSWHVHGHSHGNLVSGRGKRLDVGVDCNLVTPYLRPLTFEEVADYMSLQDFEAVDHHYRKDDPEFEKNE